MEARSSAARGADVPARRRGRRNPTPQSRTAVLRAVEDLLSTHRLDELTVSQIVDAAGISRATFYVHYDTKYSVVAALLTEVVDSVLEVWEPLFSSDGPLAEDAIAATIAATLERWSEHAALLTATVEGSHSDPEINELWSGVVDDFTRALIDRIRHAGATPNVDVDVMATALVALLERGMYMSAAAPDSRIGVSPERLAPALAHIWARSLAAG